MTELEKLAKYLSKLLSLPESAILQEDGDLTSLCLMELNSTMEMPGGFFLTQEIRVPEYGEYFMDIKALLNSDKIIVYKAVGILSNLAFILTSDEDDEDYLKDLLEDGATLQFGEGDTFFTSPWNEDNLEPANSSGFNWALCELHGGCALLHGKKIELLSNYVDPQGIVSGIMIDTKQLVLTNISELQNLPAEYQSNEDVKEALNNLLENLNQTSSKKHKYNIQKEDRMKLKFTDDPPNLDDLLNDIF